MPALPASAEQRIRHELDQLRAELERQTGQARNGSRPRPAPTSSGSSADASSSWRSALHCSRPT
ncbi:hypothetical protein H4K36_01055 [Streptomyces sp. DHE7-1]|nr:hypothetical protein [Streptomyces sp. DHE7-1]